ncbi:MAG: hypothetical protein AB2660_18580 [Candidatus Thiodiazotropha sp.]
MKTIIKYTRRKTEDTLYVQYLLHIGFSKSLIADILLKHYVKPFGIRSIAKAEKEIVGARACRIYQWPTRPSAKNPGNLIKSQNHLLEFSLYGSALLYLYGDRIYEHLSIEEIINAYDLYTNIRIHRHPSLTQLTPDTAYWIVRELSSHCAFLRYCPQCCLYYYESSNQYIVDGCPFGCVKNIPHF